ncbi:phospholipid methyltransferase [Cylindrobasidium torrendii FP15055 ss-10]|uniref:Phosphatidyl-N-methylethanolamine N-methyltransferase n=1 Tax=Cylindrobasidium torrendii FP15055 ss-10 TaxID=1314674 RepID=A0A0D7B5T8_9AGAR|nr:phospholipid methyltransferase [Cylindrobasidium torrendii FP15055 ss-10]
MEYIDWSKPSFWISVASITFNPTAWNIVARNELGNKTITRMFGGNVYRGCYFLAICIFGFGILRDMLFERALSEQPHFAPEQVVELLPPALRASINDTFPLTVAVPSFLALVPPVAHKLITPSTLELHFSDALALVLFAFGQTLVVTSTWALGITGTFLGDYFGILMDARVEGFPFNILDNPMYVGSTMCFLAVSLWQTSVAGLAITAYVYVVYAIALRFEEPWTTEIYAKRERERAAKKD